MITVNWQHIILDETVFTTYNTHRVARARERARLVGIADPFPVLAGSPREGLRYASTWSPLSDSDGLAPETYLYGGRTYDFGFWSIIIHRPGSVEGSNPSPRFPPPSRTVSGEDVTLTAKAWYVWNLQGGGGSHGLYLDAFDTGIGDFIPDDFVDVSPDDREDGTGTLTQSANEGLLITDTIDKEAIQARTPIRGSIYEFLYWLRLGSLNTIDVPEPPGAVIHAHTGDILRALAFYHRLPSPPIPPMVVPPISFYIIGNLADGPYIIFGPGGPQPVGPWDPTVLRQLSQMMHRISRDLDSVIPLK
jgi:hypothetical protein